MKATLIVLALIYSLACIGDPMMRTSYRRAPLQGKVKLLRLYSSGNNYSVDSFSNTGSKLYSHWVQNGKVLDVTEYSYDTRGKIIKECFNDSSGNVRSCKTYAYDTSQKLIEEKRYWYGQNSVRMMRIKYTYASGLLVTKEDSTWQGIKQTDYKYDDRGKMTEEVTKPLGGGSYTTKYAYDNNGNIHSETIVNSNSSYKTTYTYDKHNNEILAEEEMNDSIPGRRFTSEYIYDSHGNWIRCTEDVPGEWNDPSREVEIREIEYY